jgi:hypothetical protein
MPATLILVEDEQDWETIRLVLSCLEQGGIIMGPDAIDSFKQRYGLDPTECEEKYIDYDFGGEPDIVVDHVLGSEHMAASAVAAAMGSMRPYYENGVCPDCHQRIPADAVDGSACENCDHVFSRPRQSDGPDDG